MGSILEHNIHPGPRGWKWGTLMRGVRIQMVWWGTCTVGRHVRMGARGGGRVVKGKRRARINSNTEQLCWVPESYIALKISSVLTLTGLQSQQEDFISICENSFNSVTPDNGVPPPNPGRKQQGRTGRKLPRISAGPQHSSLGVKWSHKMEQMTAPLKT